MKKLLKRIWLRILYKSIKQKKGVGKKICEDCVFIQQNSKFCLKFNESYGKNCGIDYEMIYVKRFKQ